MPQGILDFIIQLLLRTDLPAICALTKILLNRTLADVFVRAQATMEKLLSKLIFCVDICVVIICFWH
jgi:hypothetical protein